MKLKKIIILFLTISLILFGCNSNYKKSVESVPMSSESEDTVMVYQEMILEDMVMEDEVVGEEVVEAVEEAVEYVEEVGESSNQGAGNTKIDKKNELPSKKNAVKSKENDIKPKEEMPMLVAEIADMLVDDGVTGTLFYKVDSAFTIDVTTRVEARIIKKLFNEEDTTEIKYIIEMFQETRNGEVKQNTIEVSNVMDMELVSLEDDAFIIKKISSGEQKVDGNSVTEWLWGVKPLRQGNFNLILKAIIKEDGVSKDKIVFDKIINVNNKPPKKYNINLDIPTNMKRYETYNYRLSLREKNSDIYSFEWGGFGEISLDFGGDVEVIELNDDYTIEDQISIYDFNWEVTPNGNDTVVPYEIKIIGYTEELVILTDTISVKRNFKETINRLLDKIKDKWYWAFSTLLLPLYKFIKMKMFQNKMKKKDEHLEEELEELKDELEELKDEHKKE